MQIRTDNKSYLQPDFIHNHVALSNVIFMDLWTDIALHNVFVLALNCRSSCYLVGPVHQKSVGVRSSRYCRVMALCMRISDSASSGDTWTFVPYLNLLFRHI